MDFSRIGKRREREWLKHQVRWKNTWLPTSYLGLLHDFDAQYIGPRSQRPVTVSFLAEHYGLFVLLLKSIGNVVDLIDMIIK